MKERKKLKLLSKSVLLDESGLPGINAALIIIVFLMVAAFVIWSMNMKINETVSIKGFVETDADTGELSFKALIPTKDLGIVNEGYPVVVNISGLTSKNPILGKIAHIEDMQVNAGTGENFSATIDTSNLESVIQHINGRIVPGMETNVQVITGTRSLFQYFIGPIFQIKDKAFTER